MTFERFYAIDVVNYSVHGGKSFENYFKRRVYRIYPTVVKNTLFTDMKNDI